MGRDSDHMGRLFARTHVLMLLGVFAVGACTEPQTPEGTGTPAGTTAAPTTDTGSSSAPTTTAVPTSAPTTTAAPAGGDKLTAPYVVTLRQTGGIAGMNMVTVIDSAAKKITYGGPRNQNAETRDVSADEVAEITRALEAANYATFPGQIKGGAIADAFNYEVKLTTGGKDFVVSWSDGAQVSDTISAVRAAIAKLRAAKFDGVSPKSAPTM
ncbi:MAG: hypothetical protein IPK82_39035 [Polyangiaceae bacterium]|nr:hypothetical protein [Polyangiaceae bacterium]